MKSSKTTIDLSPIPNQCFPLDVERRNQKGIEYKGRNKKNGCIAIIFTATQISKEECFWLDS